MKKSNLFNNIKNKVSGLYQKNKKLFTITLVLVFVLVICLFFYPKTSKKDNSLVQENENLISNSGSDYASTVESKLKQMLLSIDEVKEANVMVLCESTVINDYLKDKSETKNADGSTTLNEEIAYEKNGSNTSPIIISSKMPKIVGVWVIINEVSPSTKLAITNSISSVLNLNEESISILQER